ncbi:uncharacterized protein LOC117654199 [Thrips palmi]|uniref:Uncharacterized protein LOC117654199 n=1 Tax=Thrips palmi TaxID=161013 RepID=A0A6P9AFU1_THRPL|nr:uncharacterized protein LOC117654199 [Thrips palmi]
MECVVCLEPFDEGRHRPKALPCGHSLCAECVGKPELGRRCPEDRKAFFGLAHNLPDNITVLRMLTGASRSRSATATEASLLKSGKKILEHLDDGLLEFTSHAEEWRRLCDRVQEALQPEAASKWGTPRREKLSDAALLMQDADRLLSAVASCSVTVQGRDGATRSAELRRQEYVSLLLRLQDSGRLLPAAQAQPPGQTQAEPQVQQQEETGADPQEQEQNRPEAKLPCEESDPAPGTFTPAQCLDLKGKDGDEIARRRPLLQVLKLTGLDCRFDRESNSLLCVVARRLRELQLECAGVRHMLLLRDVEELRKLDVSCVVDDLFPALPASLEELRIQNCTERQLVSTQRMPRLRRLQVLWYLGPGNVDLRPPRAGHCGLQWLRVCVDKFFVATLFSLLRAHAATLKEVRLVVASVPGGDLFLGDLGRRLADCGFQALERVVLEREMGAMAIEHDAASCSRQLEDCTVV